MCALEVGQEGRAGTAEKEGRLVVYLFLPLQGCFLQAEALAKSIYKVQPWDRENCSSRQLCLGGSALTPPQMVLPPPPAGPFLLLWGRQG